MQVDQYNVTLIKNEYILSNNYRLSQTLMEQVFLSTGLAKLKTIIWLKPILILHSYPSHK